MSSFPCCVADARCQRCCARFEWTNLTLFDLTHSVAPQRISALHLAILRSALVAYYFAVLVVQWQAWDSRDVDDGYKYFTNWTFLLLFVVMATICAISWTRLPCLSKSVEPRVPQTCVAVVFVAWQTLFTAAVFLTIVYWVLLAPFDDTRESFLNYMVHGGQVAVAGVDFLLNRISFVPAHMSILYLYVAIYMLFAWFWYAGRTEWIYDFVDFTKEPGTVALTYIGIAALYTAVFFVIWFADWLKRKIFKFSLNDAGRVVEWRGMCLHDVTDDVTVLEMSSGAVKSTTASAREIDDESFDSA
jgi:hypothetical protein